MSPLKEKKKPLEGDDEPVATDKLNKIIDNDEDGKTHWPSMDDLQRKMNEESK